MIVSAVRDRLRRPSSGQSLVEFALVLPLLALVLPVASAVGVLLPMLMRSLRIDPALAGSVVLTTITDAVGFLSFLGLATLFYA